MSMKTAADVKARTHCTAHVYTTGTGDFLVDRMTITPAKLDIIVRATIDHTARGEPAPRAVNWATENCQGWIIRVSRRLVNEGIVEESAVTMLQGYMNRSEQREDHVRDHMREIRPHLQEI